MHLVGQAIVILDNLTLETATQSKENNLSRVRVGKLIAIIADSDIFLEDVQRMGKSAMHAENTTILVTVVQILIHVVMAAALNQLTNKLI